MDARKLARLARLDPELDRLKAVGLNPAMDTNLTFALRGDFRR
jgi:hypothetical protein